MRPRSKATVDGDNTSRLTAPAPRAHTLHDADRAQRRLGFRCRTDFAAVLDALREDRPLPFAHDPSYVSPEEPSR
ncbi:hypothetical protein D187_003890 [Cystobacter fuscus DSM 2262]|uniref:Uncharacterized protein n=1 Tax=Cystobacter fuscus (strain ATCC 25194 / DSM 2262 / NBRC 100088 / M29) TaxID=1242864 RepID=S9QPB0_CYSF2|nr:hypothetical protein D187_003890 [Cystobacter fuscus DSM 2262]